MTPRSIFDGGRYSSLHRNSEQFNLIILFIFFFLFFFLFFWGGVVLLLYCFVCLLGVVAELACGWTHYATVLTPSFLIKL